jgi:periplasmic divalent cation tolerance protein
LQRLRGCARGATDTVEGEHRANVLPISELWSSLASTRYSAREAIVRLILATCSPSEADALLDALLSERLVACGNLIPGVRSRYFWEGAIQVDEETLMLMETTDDLAAAAMERLRELHSYDVPKILALEPADCDARYLAWLGDVTR